MNRRIFLGGVGTAIAGSLPLGKIPVSETTDMSPVVFDQAENGGIPNPNAVKINVKPVITNVFHTGVWEGPCRFTGRMSVGEEARIINERIAKWKQGIKGNNLNFDNEYLNILEPVDLNFSEDFRLSEEEFNKFKPDIHETDVFFIDPAGSSISAFELAQKFNKPIIMTGLNCRNVDIAAYTRSKGYEAYIPANNDELKHLLFLLQSKKVFCLTKVLFPTDRGLPAVCSIGSIDDFQDLEKRFGVAVQNISYHELAEEMSGVSGNDSQLKNAEQLAGDLVKNASRSFIDTKYVAKSFLFYRTVRNLMSRYGCNAFTIECFEFCTSKLPEQWNITPCLIHALQRDRGYASSCEADLGSLLAMRLLMSVSQKSCHQGNSDPRSGDTFRINHSAPAIKMNGYAKPGLPYQLGRFVESGWGTKAVIDFAANNEKIATVARIDPTATKMIIFKGEIVGSSGWNEDLRGCSVEVLMRSPSGRTEEFLRKRIDYGNHLQWVFGDYVEDMKTIGEMLKLKVDVIS